MMQGRTHLLCGIACGIAVTSQTHTFNGDMSIYIVPALSGWTLGSLLPDIDHPKSTIARRIPAGSWLAMLFSHRGFFHSLLASVIITSLMLFGMTAIANGIPLPWQPGISSMVIGSLCGGLILGYWTHLVLDWMTPAGVPWFYPVQHRYKSLITITTGSIYETIFMIVFVTSMFVYSFK